MPALYAHNRFGKEVFERLDGALKEVIKNHYTQFCVGLQGPDIFFFYKPWKKNKVSELGYQMHDESAYTFFESGAELARRRGKNSREYAYLLGFLCHFILDSECHPYVNSMEKQIGVSHLKIESEFEKMLLQKDNKNPFSYPIAKYIATDAATVYAIHNVFEQVKEQEIKESLQTYRYIKKLLTTPRKEQQKSVKAILKIGGLYKTYAGLLHDFQDEERCKETNQELDKRFENAVTVAVQMMKNFESTVDESTNLDERFDRIFD